MTARQRLLSGRAWDDFCETLRIAGRGIERFGDEPSQLDRAEWYRFLTRVARSGLERFVENCEPDRPRLRDVPWRQSINVQCPDQDHLLAEFADGSREYRVHGERGTVPYFTIAAWSAAQPRDPGAHDWAPRGVAGLRDFDPARLSTTAFLSSDEIRFEPGGTFEVVLSQKRHPGNWLELQPESVGVLIRVVHHDRARECSPRLAIERLDRPAPRPIRPEELAAGLAKAAQAVLGYSELVRAWWQDDLARRPNQLRFSRATYLGSGGVPDRHFAFGAWRKPAGRALVVEFRPPECEYWIFQLCNLWQENLDHYEDGQGYVTKQSARPEPDGSVRIVVAERAPGLAANWIDSFGHEAGVMGLRLIKTEQPPEVVIREVPLDTLERDGWSALAAATARASEVTA